MEEETQKKTEKDLQAKLNGINKILCRVAGSDLSLLAKYRNEIPRHARIGAIILSTACLATVSMYFAIETVSQSARLALLAGVVWGCVIFVLDSYIIASYKKTGEWFSEFRIILPRLILATILGLFISIPMELKVFSNEISEELKIMEKAQVKRSQLASDSVFQATQLPYKQRIDTIQKQYNLLEQPILKLDSQITANRLLHSKEIGGVGLTPRIGDGPVARSLQQTIDVESQSLTTMKANPLLAKYETDMKTIEGQIQEIKAPSSQKVVLYGLSAQLTALDSLIKKSKYVQWAYWIFCALIMAVETAPILVKYFTPLGSYDEVLLNDDKALKKRLNQRLKEIDYLYNSENTAIESLNGKKQAHQDTLNDTIMGDIAEAQSAIAKAAINIWKDKQINRVKDNIDDFIRSSVPARKDAEDPNL